MAEGQRPGGLTALAVINFVFGGLGAIGLLLMLAAIGILSSAKAHHKVDQHVALGVLVLLTLLLAVNAFLLIASGVGYLQQKRVLGRYLGNTYGILALAAFVIGLVAGQKFTLLTIIDLVYPILTLILLNTTFKEDLVN